MKVKYPKLLKFILGIIQTVLVFTCYYYYNEWSPSVTIFGLTITILEIEKVKNNLYKQLKQTFNN